MATTKRTSKKNAKKITSDEFSLRTLKAFESIANSLKSIEKRNAKYERVLVQTLKSLYVKDGIFTSKRDLIKTLVEGLEFPEA
jgi:hypothetical protein